MTNLVPLPSFIRSQACLDRRIGDSYALEHEVPAWAGMSSAPHYAADAMSLGTGGLKVMAERCFRAWLSADEGIEDPAACRDSSGALVLSILFGSSPLIEAQESASILPLVHHRQAVEFQRRIFLGKDLRDGQPPLC